MGHGFGYTNRPDTWPGSELGIALFDPAPLLQTFMGPYLPPAAAPAVEEAISKKFPKDIHSEARFAALAARWGALEPLLQADGVEGGAEEYRRWSIFRDNWAMGMKLINQLDIQERALAKVEREVARPLLRDAKREDRARGAWRKYAVAGAVVGGVLLVGAALFRR